MAAHDSAPEGPRGAASPATHGNRARLRSLLGLGSLALFCGALLALPYLAQAPPPGLPSNSLPEGRDLGVPETAESRGGRSPGFEDATAAAKLVFRHVFLEREQGFTFQANQYNHGSGLAVADVDDDGYPDVYFVNQLGDSALLHNLGDGTFEDISEWAGVALGDRVAAGANFGDVDGDGDQDLYITSYRGGNLLFRNRGDGRFEDVSATSGLNAVSHSCSSTFFDADQDGDLDLYVVNVGKFTSSTQDPENRYYSGTNLGLYYGLERGETDFFYRNRGDGTFVDESSAVGLEDTSWGGDVAAGDLDGDGFLDLVVANMYGEDMLLMNRGGARFVNETHARSPQTSYGSMSSDLFDYDNDGDLDVLLTDMHSDMWMDFEFPLAYLRSEVRYPTPFGLFDYNLGAVNLALLRSLPKGQRLVYGNSLLRNDGHGSFEEVGAAAKVETFWPWGAQHGDFDLDGDQDVFVASGMGFPWEWWPNSLLMNQGDGTFHEEGRLRGFDDLAYGHYLKKYRLWGRAFARSVRAGAVFDYDGDGDEDAVTNGYNCHATLWRNVFERPGRHWLQVRLEGRRSNRDAIGARVEVVAGGRSQVRWVRGAQGYVSQSWKVLAFGLGDAAAVEALRVRWPSGLEQEFRVPGVDRRYRLIEGEADPQLWQPGPVARRVPVAPEVEPGWEPEQKARREDAPVLGSRPGMGSPGQLPR